MRTRRPWRTLAVRAILATLVAGSAFLPPLTVPAAAQEGRLWLIFVDDLHLDFRSTARLRVLLNTICSELIEDGDLFGSISTGPSSIAIDLTADRQRLPKAIARVTGSGLAPVDAMLTSPDPAKAGFEVPYRAAVAVATARDVVTRLAQVQNSRKAFIYVSNGYFIQVPAAASGSGRRIESTAVPASGVSAAEVGERLSELADEAKRSNVRMFAIDGRRVAGSTELDPRVDNIWWQTYWATTRNSLRAISERTDGFAILEEEELVEGLKRINTMMRR